MLNSGIVSYCFRNSEGTITESRNEKLTLLPASNMKIVSGYAAYKILGADFALRTTFSVDGKSLVIYGDPTPLLTREKLRSLIQGNEKKLSGIKEILFSTLTFDALEFGPGWAIKDIGNCYQTRVVPFAVDEGCFCAEGGCDDEKPLHDVAKSSVGDQYRHFSAVLSDLIGNGTVLKVSTTDSPRGTILFEYREKLSDILSHIETYSCNFSAEVLTKYLSYRMNGEKGNWTGSTDIINGLMKSTCRFDHNIRIVDGSGLSRINLLTTEFLTDLMHSIYSAGDVGFLEMLPSPGSGTLRDRLSDLGNLGLHAKTGSLEYCSSLSGYIRETESFFSIIINNSIDSPKEIMGEIDSILMNHIQAYGAK